MPLPRTFVGFSSTDLHCYRLMKAWKANEHIDFDFVDCQLQEGLNSDNEDYIKRVCRQRINMAGKYIMLIGEDTRYKYKYVRWEAEVVIEKGCTIIGVNLDRKIKVNYDVCPPVIRNIGAIFVAYTPKIIAHALNNYKMKETGDYYYAEEVYQKLGYTF